MHWPVPFLKVANAGGLRAKFDVCLFRARASWQRLLGLPVVWDCVRSHYPGLVTVSQNSPRGSKVAVMLRTSVAAGWLWAAFANAASHHAEVAVSAEQVLWQWGAVMIRTSGTAGWIWLRLLMQRSFSFVFCSH